MLSSLTECLGRSDGEKELIYQLTFKCDGNVYIYFPEVLSNTNDTFIGIDEYSIINGNGEVNSIVINGHRMLNITIFTEEIEIEYRKKTTSKSLSDYTYSNISFNSTINAMNVKVFYSGKGTGHVETIFEIKTTERYTSYKIGPQEVHNGWNSVLFHKDGWVV